MKTAYVLCLKLEGGLYEPLAWTKEPISKRKARRAASRFRNDRDVCGFTQMECWRLYSSIDEMKRGIPELI